MNYQKIYDSLINQAKNRAPVTGYYEQHHVVPRCLGGTDSIDNLVNLTPEEHYVAHQLLAKIHKENHKILFAAAMMCVNRPTNKLYGWIRRRLSTVQSNAMSGSGNTMFNKRWVSNENETKLVEFTDAEKLINSGLYIAGKVAKKASCGCLVKDRCIVHENKKLLALEKRNIEFKEKTRALFEEFIASDITSITQFAKLKNTSQPALTKVWKKHIPEYSEYVKQGAAFKKSLTEIVK
jgi:hypothetical protein